MKIDEEPLDVCFAYIISIDVSGLKSWLAEDEEKALGQAHHTIGGHIRNHFKLWEGGVIKDWFNTIGIYHADDMSSIILTSFHRKMNNKPTEIKKQIKRYRDFWKKQNPRVNKGFL